MQIAFLESKKMKATMVQDIDESQLPEPYGGKLKLVSIEHNWSPHTYTAIYL